MNLSIITGGTKGLGLALTQELRERGDHVVVIGRTTLAESPELASYPFDLSVPDSRLEQLFNEIFSQFPAVNYERISLVNNAAMITPIRPVQKLNLDAVAESIALNLTAPILVTAEFLRHTDTFTGTRIVLNISSGVAKRPLPSWSAYSAAKAGLENFSQTLALEFEQLPNSHVLCINPGIMDTDMQAAIRATDRTDFPQQELFASFKSNGDLNAPETVARAIGRLLHSTELTAVRFAAIQELLAAEN